MVKLTGLLAALGAASLVSSAAVPLAEVAAPKIERDTTAFCAGGSVSRADVVKCRDFINAFGNGKCTINNGEWKTLCIINGVTIFGVEQDSNAASVSSSFSDVAWGVTWLLENCGVKGRSDLVQTGLHMANGNSHITVWTTGNQ